MKVRIVTILTGAFVCLALVTGCSAQNTPLPSAERAVTSTPSAPTSTPTLSPTPVAKPWQPGEFQKGLQVYWHANGEPLASVISRAGKVMDYVVSTGANSVGITFPIYTDGQEPTHVYSSSETPTPAELTQVIAAAKQRKLHVLLRPSIDEANLMTTPDAWRGSISPPDSSAWFESYIEALTPYWQVAQAAKADEVSLGIELTSLESYSDEWTKVQTAANTVFSGTISYAINWRTYSSGGPVQPWGVDAYPSIDLADTASVEELTEAWNTWLAKQPLEARHSITLEEVGIPAEEGKYLRPWSWGDGDALNLTVQANWFTASCQAAKQSEVAGIYYWMIDSNIDFSAVNPETDPPGIFVGRPAEAALKACFS